MTRVLLLPFINHHYCLDTCGPCNNLHYLGHVKNVYDNGDDDRQNWDIRVPRKTATANNGGHGY